MVLSQEDRLIRIATSLDKDNTFIPLSFEGAEAISDLYSFELKLASESPNIKYEDMIGKNATISIRGKSERFFNGIIIEFSPIRISEKQSYSIYQAALAPVFWTHTLTYDLRIFQNQTVKEIITKVLNGATLGDSKIPKIDHRMDLTREYAKMEYCTQYSESNFDFISRICEENGIFYYFEHRNGGHTLVFTDDSKYLAPFAGGEQGSAAFQKTIGANLDREVITFFKPAKKLSTSKFTATDYNFKTPKAYMTIAGNTKQNKSISRGELYEYPGGFKSTSGHGEKLAGIRMEALDARSFTIQGQSNYREFTAGRKFRLQQFVINDMNDKEYLLTRVHHSASQHFISGATGGDVYFNIFDCIPHSVAFRPLRKTPKPVIHGSQTAIVTGPAGEEIHTDEYGRIKVKFHWDRSPEQGHSGSTSCWIRVPQLWAGGKYGALFIPRVGMEVLVNFLYGDPDYPIIAGGGSLYHGNNRPPYDLPAQKTKSTIMSDSSKGSRSFNEIRFEDLTGEEEFYTHAANNQNEEVENDMTTKVGANQSIKVEKNRSVTVACGNETLAVQSGGRTVTVQSDESHTNAANYRQQVNGDFTLKVNGRITISASDVVTIDGSRIILNA